MSEHGEHPAGTVSRCLTCSSIAYEPGWYAAMLAFTEGRNLGPNGVRPDDRTVAAATLTGSLWT